MSKFAGFKTADGRIVFIDADRVVLFESSFDPEHPGVVVFLSVSHAPSGRQRIFLEGLTVADVHRGLARGTEPQREECPKCSEAPKRIEVSAETCPEVWEAVRRLVHAGSSRDALRLVMDVADAWEREVGPIEEEED